MPDDQTNAQHLLAQWDTLMGVEAAHIYNDAPLPNGHRARRAELSNALEALGWDINPDVSGLPTWKYYGPPS
jgi:hypothetical protein